MAPNVPWEIRLTLRAGAVYYFPHRGLTSPEPHYFIVVNSNPLGDQVLLLAVVSSKVEKVRQRRRNQPRETLVEIAPAEYDELKVLSIVDCNQVFRKTLAELVEDKQRRSLQHRNNVPSDVLKRIQTGIKLSPLVEEEAKALIK